jgi:3-oxoacyl-[acyl-carrier-protein] synthase-1/3-oxoacyl-[acyl-carrier-protein] synthase II
MEILLRGIARTALAGGVDSLCRLTYFGFDSLKLIDPNGPGPFDRDRAGMCVSEGCGMLLLAAAEEPPSDTIAELRGGGLSCDAYHPAAPHPDGEGALAAMRAALENAGLTARDISYVNCHGTGTRDNDLSEARAMKALFGENIPPFSSQKGSFGHTLAASGAIEAAVSALSIRDGFIPPNAGFKKIDPDIGLCPQSIAFETRVDSVMSNSFGFGGNNASVILAKPGMFDEIIDRPNQIFFIVRGCSLYTAAGGSEETLRALADTGSCAGTAIMPDSPGGLQPREVRRLKRLSRLALSLAHDAAFIAPASVFMGTAWGALSETSDFLDKLYESGERYSSPTDFMGSVHNSPAGNVAIRLGAKGPNITVTDGDSSFEHALFAASILSNGDALIIGADEYHEKLSPLFDPVLSKAPCDGGGALFLGPCKEENGVRISPVFFGFPSGPEVVEALIESLLKASLDASKFGAVLAGSAHSRNQDGLWKGFLSSYRPDCPVIYYHDFIGRHSSASAVAAALSCMFVKSGSISIKSQNPEFIDLAGRGVLLLNFGDRVTAVAVMP